MKTKSIIAYVNQDGKVHQIYCHFDAEPSHHGPILFENYNSLELAKKLIDNGNIEILSADLDNCISLAEGIYKEKNVANNMFEFFNLGKKVEIQYYYIFIDNNWEAYDDQLDPVILANVLL
jgi:hypothetical protein